MGTIGLAAPIWFGISALVLFCALLIVRFTFSLVHEIKDLGRGVKRANDHLQRALGEVRVEAEAAQEKVSGIAMRKRKSRRP